MRLSSELGRFASDPPRGGLGGLAGARALGLCWVGLAWIDTAHAGAPPTETTEATDELAPEPAPEPEPEPEPTSAREWYDRGIELGNSGDFVGAAEAFLRSYELQPTSEALYNAGFAYQQAGDALAAIDSYRRLLEEPERNEELAQAAEASIAELLQAVGTLKGIRYAPSRPPAELYVGGRRYEPDELPILLAPGPVLIEVVDEQGERARETYEVAAGEALVVDLRALLPPRAEPPGELGGRVEDQVEDDPGPSPEPLATTPTQARRAKQLRTATWIGVGLTGAAGLSAVTLALLANRERSTYLGATCHETGTCPEGFEIGDPEGNFTSYERYRLGTAISVGIVGGLAIGTLVVGLLSWQLERKAARKNTRVRLAPSPGGLVLSF
ncbi:MAG: hypothetical protein R6X02_16695 [Enhygromyxa sp.]